MPISLTATLLAASEPRPVQLALAGTAAGQAYEVRGTTGDGSSWSVPGGRGTSSGNQILLVDNRSALNVAVTYQAVVDGVTYTATPVTITSSAVAVVQTIDGQTVVPVEVASVTEPRKATTRGSTFDIAGRRDPAARLDVPAGFAYEWVLETQGADTAALTAILSSGRPIVRRTVTGLRDVKPVVLAIVSSWSDELITSGFDTWRRFTIGVREISDPQPSTPLAAYDWGDFDLAMASRVWSWHGDFSSPAGWAASGGSLSQQSGGYLTDKFARVTASAAGTVQLVESAYAAAAVSLGEPVVAGQTYSVSARVKGAAGRSASAIIRWSNGAVVAGSAVALTGSWQMVTVTVAAPAGVTGLATGARMAATAANDQFDVSSIALVKGATASIGTFDELWATWDDFDATDWASLQ